MKTTEKKRAYKTKWRLANPEKMQAARKNWLAKNRGHANSLARKWQKAHPEKVKAAMQKWAKKNAHLCAAKRMRRHASKLRATPAWANKFFIEEIYDLSARRTKLKSGGHAKWHVDHLVPLQSNLVCGLHVEHNLQVIPAAQNISKHNKIWPQMP